MRAGRSLHRERGLKFDMCVKAEYAEMSLPSQGAWIEILYAISCPVKELASLPSQGAWIEILITAL